MFTWPLIELGGLYLGALFIIFCLSRVSGAGKGQSPDAPARRLDFSALSRQPASTGLFQADFTTLPWSGSWLGDLLPSYNADLSFRDRIRVHPGYGNNQANGHTLP
jgi:hypothetical protein